VLAVAAQLARHLGGRLALGEAPKDQEDLGGAAVRPRPGGPGPGVEDAAALPALGVQDRLAVARVDVEALPLSAAGAGPPVGVEELDELTVTGVLVHVVDQGEIPGRGPRATRGISREPNDLGYGRQETRHRIGLMSHSVFF
jgi:hypothetical protein